MNAQATARLEVIWSFIILLFLGLVLALILIMLKKVQRVWLLFTIMAIFTIAAIWAITFEYGGFAVINVDLIVHVIGFTLLAIGLLFGIKGFMEWTK
jgi:hypothetical protein